MSYRRYLRTAIPMAAGMNTKEMKEAVWMKATQEGVLGPTHAYGSETDRASR